MRKRSCLDWRVRWLGVADPLLFKQRIVSILSQEYKVEFLGKDFDYIVGLLSDSNAEKIFNWVQDVMDKSVQPIVVGSRKKYKEWSMNELLTFRYPFTVGNSQYRILFVKVKNSVYIEFHLGDHKYYDKVRKELDMKNG